MALKNFEYNQILREYDRRQFDNKHALDIRRQEAYNKIPELKALDEDIITSSISNARQLLNGNETNLELLKEENMTRSMRKIELLLEYGYPANYLNLWYDCPDCKDTGFIDGIKCHCFKQAIVDSLYQQSNIKSVIENENFSTFSLLYYSNDYVEPSTKLTPLANAKKVAAACKNFIAEFDTAYSNLLIYGNTGVGKTFLCNCIAKELLDHAHVVVYLTSFQLFDIMEKYKFQKDDYKDIKNEFEMILDCDLLILDDLGTELNNSFITSQLYLCINERHLRQKSTIISTNLSWNDLKNNYSERIFSRITSNYLFLKLIGEDIRLKKVFS